LKVSIPLPPELQHVQDIRQARFRRCSLLVACVSDVDIESSNKMAKVRIFLHDIPQLLRTNVPRTWFDTNLGKYVVPCTLSKGTGDEGTKEKGLPRLAGRV
jgi:hypothetical protein